MFMAKYIFVYKKKSQLQQKWITFTTVEGFFFAKRRVNNVSYLFMLLWLRFVQAFCIGSFYK